MSFRPPNLKHLRAAILGGILASLFLGFIGTARPAQAQIPPVYPCGSMFVQNECHFYDQLKAQYDKALNSFQFAVVTGLLNSLQFVTQRIAIDAAQWVLNGGNAEGTAFYDKTFGDYFAELGEGAANQFISDINKFTSKEFGFNLCAPISVNLQLTLGLGRISTLPPPDCTFKQIADSFEQTYRALEPDQLSDTIKKSIRPGGNDIGVAISANQQFLNKVINTQQAGILDRLEGGGLKPLTDLVSGKVKTPVQVAKDTIYESNSLKLVKDQTFSNTTVLALSALAAGLEQLPVIAASTFLNTLAVGALQKFFDSLNSVSSEIANVDLSNPDAQASAESGPKTTAITDILTPNLISNEKQDFLFELSTCNDPRGLWGCSMDSGFATALQNITETGGYTIARASGVGLNTNDASQDSGLTFLHEDWELIPESDAADSLDSGCYSRAYCSTNLAKLRFARIISSGWELAANSPFNKKVNGKYVTLGDVIRGYNVCNDQGELDADHPWCHLIDPSWVLTMPQFQCRIKGYSDSLVGEGAGGVRIQECSDVISCIERDDGYNCIGGYGYCLSEKTVWRFGADSCSERYVSCRTYTTRDKEKSLATTELSETATGPKVSYIRNTIDYGSCNADNVGCMFYRNVRNPAVTSTTAWTGGLTSAFSSTSSPDIVNWRQINGDRVYFDATAEPCAEGDAGCTKVYDVQPNQSSLNLVKNGSFETEDNSSPVKLNGWDNSLAGPAKYVFSAFAAPSGESAFHGTKSAELPNTNKLMHQRVRLYPLRNYVFSLYARAGSTPGGFLSAVVIPERYALPGDPQASIYTYPDGVQTHLTAAASFYQSANCTASRGFLENSISSTEWKRYTCEFTSPPDSDFGRIVVGGQYVAVDAVQLEEGPAATPFVDGVNIGLTTEYLKLPPEELNCQGLDTDHPDCANYARICRQSDAGCQGYTDVGGGDFAEIPAILSSNDLCPNSCVGYAQYQKLPSGFDLVKNASVAYLNDPNDETNAYFIPKQAEGCSAAAVGCDEFTNVETPELGGESKLYVTYARACLNPSKPGNAGLTRTYFTWEGSDTTGFQLKTWSLIQKGNDPAPFDPSYVGVANAPRILRKAGPDGVVKDPAVCDEELWKTGEDADCRQVYDEAGTVYYRFFSQTIVSSTDCRDYRKNNSNFGDCTKTGGDFNQQTNECIYHILAAESAQCSAVDASCRGYIGTTGRNTGSVYEETFASASGTAFVAGNAQTSASYSTESLLVGDYSLRIARVSGNQPLRVDTKFESTTTSVYSVSFWAKTTDPNKVQASVYVNGSSIATFVTETDWRRYEFGPFRVTAPTTTTVLSLRGLPNISFLDEVRVTRLQDIVYVRQNQWTIPPECDRTAEGIPQPQAMLGCREYNDRLGRVADVRQFSRLCRFEAVACTAYVDTRDSDDPYEQTFVMTGVPEPDFNDPNAKRWDTIYSGTATTTRPADRFVYAVDEPAAHCDSTAASCRAFGRPKFDNTMALDVQYTSSSVAIPGSAYETVYLKDDITKYVDENNELQMLCRPSELFCDRFVSQAATSYFRDPLTHTCEWKEKVVLEETADYPDGEYSGWFVKDAKEPTPCYPGVLSRGNTFLFEYSGTPKYEGWVSTCPEDQSECTEFRDVNDTTDQAHPNGKPYFFINNSRLDKSTCAGEVDPFGGCVLFRDMNDSRLLFSAKATYDKSHAENDNAVAPVDCVNDPTNPYCANAGHCTDVRTVDCIFHENLGTYTCHHPNEVGTFGYDDVDVNNTIASLSGATCNTNADCTGLSQDFVVGTCAINDANTVIKVKLDRDCTTWLGCSTGETVYDPQQASYVNICTDLSVCDESLGATGKDFCAHYIDRTPTASVIQKPGIPYQEPVLRQGLFFDLPAYTKRPTGFNVPDYSGYSIPNHFQLADLQPRRVAYELLVNRKGPGRDKYVRDYRLTASSPLRFGSKQQKGPDALAQLSFLLPGESIRYSDPSFSDLNLCQHGQTGRLGYYNPGETPARCYFAVDAPYSSDVNEVLTGDSQFNPRNVTNILAYFEQLQDPAQDQDLTNAFPLPECRAYPDAQSPFPNSYVQEWDLTKDPPRPLTYVDGYDGVSYCEFGEECACSYRKISYSGGLYRYYSIYGAPPPVGVCVGGSRDGQSCVPGAVVSDTAVAGNADEGTRSGEADGTAATDVCDGGQCQAIDTISIVRGQYAYCLQRDTSRSVAGSQEFNPCLIWNPTPVLFGPNDIYHYQPTASYLPPQNSGEYYCIASAAPPEEFDIESTNVPSNLDPDGVINWFSDLPGQLQQFYFDEDFISDADCFACVGNDGEGDDFEDITFIDGVHALGGEMGAWCESADDTINAGHSAAGLGAVASTVMTGEPISGAIIGAFANTAHFVDTSAGRWIMTGRGTNKNYMEYFIPFNTKRWAAEILPGADLSDPDDEEQVLLEATMERQFAYFSWDLMINQNGLGIMGCGATPDWAEGVTIDDFDDEEKLKTGQQQFEAYFHENFDGTMTRESSDFLRDADGAIQKVQCKYSQSNPQGIDDGTCYYKFWEIGYRDDGMKKFQMESIDEFGRRFDSESYYSSESDASHPFFSIRAMFEDSNPSDNEIAEEDVADGNALGGPFRFIGWWVTASMPGAPTERAIYLTLKIGHADTCSEVAQVVAPDTREATAFNDRVSEGGGFSIPLLGYVYSSVNPPFGGAVHTRPIGIDPLFQTHGTIPGTKSVLKPPGFIASGLEYFRAQNYPKGNWGWLNNIFARVYKVYHYYDQPVSENTGFCIDGPNAGGYCPPGAVSDANGNGGDEDLALKYCGFVGTCNTYLVDPAKAPGACNALSGVNAGLTCDSDLNNDEAGYHVCHNAAVRYVGGVITPQYGDCELSPGWGQSATGENYIPPGCSDAAACGYPKSIAAKYAAFRCGKGTVRSFSGQRALCGGVETQSKDCPMEIIGDGNVNTNTVGSPNPDGFIHSGCDLSKHQCTNGFEHAQCNKDSDCQFTAQEFWGSYRADKPWGGLPESVAPIKSDTDIETIYNNLVPTYFNPIVAANLIDDHETFRDYAEDYNDHNSGPAYPISLVGYRMYKEYLNYGLPEWKALEILGGQFGYEDDVIRAFHDANPGEWFEYYDDGDGYAGGWSGAGGNGDGDYVYVGYGQDRDHGWQGGPDDQDLNGPFVSVGRIWWTDHDQINGTSYESGEGDTASDKDIGGKNLAGGGFIRKTFSPTQTDPDRGGAISPVFAGTTAFSDLNRFPGAYAASIVAENYGGGTEIDDWGDARAALFIPGHCERPPNKSLDDDVSPKDEDVTDQPDLAKSVYRSIKDDKPYAETTYFCPSDGDVFDFDGNADSESNIVDGPECNFDTSGSTDEVEWRHWRRYYGGEGEWIYGICEGGANEGIVCNNADDCKPQDMTDAEINAAKDYCKSPVSTDPAVKALCTPDSDNDGVVDFACDEDSTNLDLDCNLCTHNAGYYPLNDICGSDPLRSQCLTGYVLKGNERANSVNQDKTNAPTDVTEGFYTPDILGAPQNFGDFGYIAYYTPRGPTIAAPDTAHGCPSPGQCPISLVNTFSLENLAEGKVAYIGGQAIANIRFYGWTPDNQGALKDLWVDWGDGAVQEFHDSKMKNRKPFCGVGNECQFVPGLTCSTDNDCPPAGGKCIATGVCSAHPYLSCSKDSDCGSESSDETCIARTGFGSTTDACDPNYFEFTHAYACGAEWAGDPTKLCGTQKYCARDNSRACSSNSQCAPGDSCISGLAPPGGCYDATLSSCRFTPRVLLKDNWGWCTGECRITDLGGGILSSGAVGLQDIYYKNAGCYDASALYKNTNPKQKVISNNSALQNSCDPQTTAGTNARPWIVFKGALQLGVAAQ